MRPAFYVSLNIYFVNRNASVFPLWPWGEAGGWAWGRGLPASPVGWVVGPRRGGRPRIPPPHRRGPDGAVGKSGPPPGTGAAGPGRPPEVGGGSAGAVCGSPPRKSPGAAAPPPGKAPAYRAGALRRPGPRRCALPTGRAARRGCGSGRGERRRPLPGEPGLCIQICPGRAGGGGRGGVFWLFFFKLCPH